MRVPVKILAIFICIAFCGNISFAKNIRLKYQKVNMPIFTSNLEIEQIQTKIQCKFSKKNEKGLLVRRRYPQTHTRKVSKNEYVLKIKKSSLTEFLPGFERYNCAYILIVLAKADDGRTYLGDIVLQGKDHQKMEDQDILDMANYKKSSNHIKYRIENMLLGLDPETKSKIVDLKVVPETNTRTSNI